MMKHVKDNLVFLCISATILIVQPAIVRAQTEQYRSLNFTEPLSLSRGSLSPVSRGGEYLEANNACKLAVQEWGWAEGDCSEIETIVLESQPGIDTMLVSRPNSEGYVKMDDWETDSGQAIDDIWDAMVDSLAEQSRVLGIKIEPVRWLVRPTLVRDRSYMYYATLMNWNGEPTINVKATKFDRYGYVTFLMVPVAAEVSGPQLKGMVETALDSYQPAPKQSYFDFSEGDKVAAVGAVGVLATLVGVKYSKGLFATIAAFALLALKKAWFLLLAAPLAFFRRFFKRGGEED